MQAFFTALYATLISFFQNQKPPTFGLYKTVVFSSVGWQTLGLTLLLAVLFYYVVYGFFNGPSRRRQLWTVFLLLAAGIAATVAAYVSVKQGAVSTTPISRSYRTYFAVVNAVIGALAFFLWSLAVKWKSTHASKTPF